jgi:hypothetical protein
MKLQNVSDAVLTLAIGIVSLYAFFIALGAIGPGDVVWLTVLVVILAIGILVHMALVRRALHEGGPNPTRRALNAMRERRGF